MADTTRLSQLVVEVVHKGTPQTRLAQLVAEVITKTVPTLSVAKATGYSVLKTPEALNTSKGLAYAVLSTEVTVGVSKAVAYAVLEDYVPSGTGHSYWRLNFGTVTGHIQNPLIYINIATLELRATIGGADQCSGGTATSCPYYGSQTPALAFDGNVSTYWESNYQTTQGIRYLQYQFPNPVDVAEYKIRNGPYISEGPRRWDLEYSDDGVSWTPVSTIRDQPVWAAGEERVFQVYNVENKFWRLNVADTDINGLGIYLSITALAMHTVIGGPDVCSGGFGDSGGAFDVSHLGALAFDGNGSTYFDASTSGIAEGHKLRYTFPNATNIVEYAITAPNNHFPYSWTFEKSSDGSNWTVVDTQVAQIFTPGETKTYAIEAAPEPSIAGSRPFIFMFS